MENRPEHQMLPIHQGFASSSAEAKRDRRHIAVYPGGLAAPGSIPSSASVGHKLPFYSTTSLCQVRESHADCPLCHAS
jgi:hypothetical protein